MLITREDALIQVNLAYDMIAQRKELVTTESLQAQLMQNMLVRNREYGDMTYRFPVDFLEEAINGRTNSSA